MIVFRLFTGTFTTTLFGTELINIIQNKSNISVQTGESVALSKNTRKHGPAQALNGWVTGYRARLCARPQISHESNLSRFYKSPSNETINRGLPCYTHAKRSHTHVKILQAMSEFRGLWKQQNNPACTKSASLHNAEVGHYTEKEESFHFTALLLFDLTIQLKSKS